MKAVKGFGTVVLVNGCHLPVHISPPSSERFHHRQKLPQETVVRNHRAYLALVPSLFAGMLVFISLSMAMICGG